MSPERLSASHNHQITVFEAAHLDGVRWIEEEHARMLGIERALKTYEGHPSYTGWCDGRFLAAAGIVVPYAGLGEAWCIAGPLVQSHKLWFHRNVKAFLSATVKRLGLRRLQAMVRAEYVGNCLWLLKLGFQYEATMKRYGVNGEDMYLYALLPEEQR